MYAPLKTKTQDGFFSLVGLKEEKYAPRIFTSDSLVRAQIDPNMETDVILTIDPKRNHTSKGGDKHRIACGSSDEAALLATGIHDYIRNVFPEIRRCRLVSGVEIDGFQGQVVDVTANMQRLLKTRSDYQLRRHDYDKLLAGERVEGTSKAFVPTFANSQEEITKIFHYNEPVQFWSDTGAETT